MALWTVERAIIGGNFFNKIAQVARAKKERFL